MLDAIQFEVFSTNNLLVPGSYILYFAKCYALLFIK